MANEFDRIIEHARQIRDVLGDLDSAYSDRVHFRPTDSGITMIGLVPDRPQRGRGGYSAASLLRSFEEEFQKWCVNVTQGRPTPEKELQSFLIANAYRHNRSMTAFASADGVCERFTNVRFVTDEQSINIDGNKVVCDLLAVRSQETGHSPVLIELKSRREMARLVDQIDGYTEALLRFDSQFEELYSAVLCEEISFVGPPERWLV